MVNFGIVGFGLHAVRRMMPGFRLAKNCRVTALSRRDRAKAEASAREFDIPHAFTSAADLCRSPHVDAVFVTTPNSLHLNDVLTAVAAGKPVLCEKPMAMNAGECRQMVEAARAANILLGIAHVFRFEESTNYLRDKIASGDIGRPVFARSEFSFFASPEHPREWLHDRKLAGGGPIVDIGVHCIDTLRFILQDEVVSVRATAASDDRSNDVEASAALLLVFSRGTLASVPVSYRAPYRTPIEVVGEQGALRADDGLTVDRPVTIELRREGKTVASETVSNHLSYGKQVDAFVNAVEGRTKFPVTGEDGWQNQEVLDAAFRSIRSGRAEDVPRVVR